MKEKEKDKKKINIKKILKCLCYFKKLVIEIILDYSRKNVKQKVLSNYFLSKISTRTLYFFRFVTSLLEIPEKASFHPYKFWKTLWHPLETSRSKSKRHGNSTWVFVEHLWKLLFLFSWPLEFPHVLSSITLEIPYPQPPLPSLSKEKLNF